MKKVSTPVSYKVNQSIRRDWGSISPITKVIPSKKGKKLEKLARKTMKEAM